MIGNRHQSAGTTIRALLLAGIALFVVCLGLPASIAFAQDGESGAAAAEAQLDVRELIRAGGAIGMIIAALSVAMLALIVEHLFSIRRNALMPAGLAESVHQHLNHDHIAEADQQCKLQPSFLSHILSSGLAEVEIGFSSVEKAMEDATVEQTARLLRKIEYLSVIGTLAPMLGLLGTVWGMILAFLEFESKANPQVAELAPGIYKALVTTLMGLGVAVPALASFAIFRNRIDELAGEAALTAGHVFADWKRKNGKKSRRRRSRSKSKTKQDSTENAESQQQIRPVTIEPNR